MKSSDKGKGLTRRDMLGRTTVIAAAGVTGLAGGVSLQRLRAVPRAALPHMISGLSAPSAKLGAVSLSRARLIPKDPSSGV